MSRLRALAGNLALSTLVGATVLLLAEVGLRAFERPKHRPLHVLCHCPYLYGQNPARPDVSPQGLRDRVFAIPKPEGVYRVLVLGDSIAYGVGVPLENTFSKLLERRLAGRSPRVEVVNSGVLGYTAYNEVEYYLARGRAFQPDLVVVAFCRNDVVDPELHWSGTPREVPEVPPDAIPDPDYHRTHVRAILGPSWPFIGRRSHLLQRLALLGDPRRRPDWDKGRFATLEGKRWPTYLTDEDDLGIQVLCDYDSPEWRWLRGIYSRLGTAVAADGARLALLLLPLSYELEDGYPFQPAAAFARYCRESGLFCLDALEPLRQHRALGVFPAGAPGSVDVWHPTAQGHATIASALEERLTEAQLLPAPLPSPPPPAPVHPASRHPAKTGPASF